MRLEGSSNHDSGRNFHVKRFYLSRWMTTEKMNKKVEIFQDFKKPFETIDRNRQRYIATIIQHQESKIKVVYIIFNKQEANH